MSLRPSDFRAIPAAKAVSVSLMSRRRASVQPGRRGDQVGAVEAEGVSESMRRSVDQMRGLDENSRK